MPALPVPWVPTDVQGADRFSKIHGLALDAAHQAALSFVPTPVKLPGLPLLPEGLSGGAYVVLDGRTAFARWMKTKGNATSLHRGVGIPAVSPTDSAERARAFAIAYASVLELNGVRSRVESYLS